MTTVPPLPEPGLQSPEDCRAIGRRFIQQAREELAQGHRLQAGEKAWGAVAHNLKAIGDLRGWRHESHRGLENIGRHIVAEYNQPELGNAISDANHIGRFNFYENQRNPETIRDLIETVEETLPSLEALQFAARGPLPSLPINSAGGWRNLRGTTSCKSETHPPWGFPCGISLTPQAMVI